MISTLLAENALGILKVTLSEITSRISRLSDQLSYQIILLKF